MPSCDVCAAPGMLTMRCFYYVAPPPPSGRPRPSCCQKGSEESQSFFHIACTHHSLDIAGFLVLEKYIHYGIWNHIPHHYSMLSSNNTHDWRCPSGRRHSMTHRFALQGLLFRCKDVGDAYLCNSVLEMVQNNSTIDNEYLLNTVRASIVLKPIKMCSYWGQQGLWDPTNLMTFLLEVQSHRKRYLLG